MHKYRQFLWLGLIMSLFLVACGGSVDPEDAERALEDAFAGETDALNELVCEESVIDEATALPEGVTFKEVDCTPKGLDEMSCEAVFEDADADEQTITIVFRVQDELLCEPSLE